MKPTLPLTISAIVVTRVGFWFGVMAWLRTEQAPHCFNSASRVGGRNMPPPAVGPVLGGPGEGVVVELIVRLKPPKIGDVVRVRSCKIYFYLPEGLPKFTVAVLVGRDLGRYIVEALRRTWYIATQCVPHEEEMLLGRRCWTNGIGTCGV